ncbi:hypothetical protein HZP35_14055 [Elizabethkingia anophelis]|nr:hypothetical protein [Elizabethkingia anophelis]MCT4170299.1 hypothetical protein [Elizabethkingia anophelis]MCT4244801.1 hypothetical protein [Elizabethkingia anophelis]MCT4248449.1 hypothetical protein [Elizabethkingia anophelis]MCT4259439.1 hypothetical protein [Elizabethkingia anophelis]
MKQITKSGPSGFQKVVFDEITAHYPGGVHVDKTSASARFTDGVLPAGTVLVPGDEGKFNVINEALTDDNLVGAIGLTTHDIVIDDFPLVAVAIAATFRAEALPDLEQAGVELIKKALPRLTSW